MKNNISDVRESVLRILGLDDLGIGADSIANGVLAIRNESSCHRLLSEPNATVLRAAGIEALECGGDTEIKLVSRNGIWIRAKLPTAVDSCTVSELPLYKPRKDYIGPTYKTVSDAIKQFVPADLGIPIIVDTYLPVAGIQCRPRIGCMPATHYRNQTRLDAGDSIKTRIYKPRIVQPTLLSWIYRRIAGGSHTYHVPWICIGGGNDYLAIICTPPAETCRVSVNDKGLAALEEGVAVALRLKRCSPPWLYTAYLVGNVLSGASTRLEAKKPAIWSPTGLVPLYASVARNGKSIAIQLVVWNPSPIAVKHELVIEEYRIRDGWLYTGLSRDWEELIPSFNRVHIPLSRNQLAIVSINGVELPPLLRRRV